MQTFPPIIWIFTEGEGDGIESRLPFKTFSTLNWAIPKTCYVRAISILEMLVYIFFSDSWSLMKLFIFFQILWITTKLSRCFETGIALFGVDFRD